MRAAGTGDEVATESGYTLVELSVVLLILSVLAGIAISTYLSQTRKADRSAAISSLANMRLVGESIRADDPASGYSEDLARYEESQPSYTYVDGATPSTDASVISVHSPDPTWVAFAVRGRDACYYLRLDDGAATLAKSTALIDGTTVECRAQEFPSGTDGTGAWG